MLKTLSTYFVRTLRDDPADAEVQSHKLLVRAGYIRRTAPGIYTWLPLGLRVLRKVEAVVRQEMDRMGGQEVLFPALLPAEPYKATQRWEEYGPTLFKLKDRREGDYLLAPTHEEMFTLLVKDLYSSYKDLPLTLYQIQTKYRDEARPRAGVIRGREFVMKDAYSFDLDEEGLDASYLAERAAYQAIFTRLGLEYVIVSAMSGPMGGSRSEEFLHPSPIGEDTFVRSPGGYAANAEAVTTPIPEALPLEGLPEAVDLETPDSTTILALVERANALHPRADRPWQASDTLKNVVVALTHPHG
ncbi:MAG: proline--tRNA ligase, partial [Actinomyces sp.]|nr:proline--tRNA ligase [Actinomyces sp.]